jgi:hypothetical protein
LGLLTSRILPPPKIPGIIDIVANGAVVALFQYQKNNGNPPSMDFQLSTDAIPSSTLKDAANALRVDHFNFFQIGEIDTTSINPNSPDYIQMLDAKDKPLLSTFIDPPSGGLHGKKGGEIKVMQWADDLPWYLDESSPKQTDEKGSWTQDELLANNLLDADGKVSADPKRIVTLKGKDAPGIPFDIKIKFRTYVVGEDPNGKKLDWIAGVEWEWSRKGKVPMISSATEIDLSKPGVKAALDAELKKLGQGFRL